MASDQLTPGGPAGAGGPGHESRIHNIGYRRYDGPRLGRRYATRSLYAQSLRSCYGLGRSAKSKVLPIILFVAMTAPALILVAVTVYGDLEKLPLDYTRYAILLQAVISLFLAAQAPQSVSKDLRFRTVPLYFSRPIEHRDYVRAKYAAMASALFVLTAVPVIVLYVGALLGKLDFGDQTKGFLQGMVSVAVLSVLFAGIGLVVAAITPRRGFGIAAIIALLVVSYGAVSAVQAVAYTQDQLGAVRLLGLLSPITLVDGLQGAFLGADVAYPGQPHMSAAYGVLYLLVIAAVVAGSYGILLRRYRKIGL